MRIVRPPSSAPRTAQQAVFRGHSGARITLLKHDDRTLVRKMAGSAAQSERLRRQGEKQAAFFAAGVDTPRVLASGEEDGLAFFDMDYVPGTSVAALACDGLGVAGGGLAGFVAGWIAACQQRVDGVVPAETLTDKLASVLSASVANRHLGAAAARLPDLAAKLRAVHWPAAPRSPCHGDFTTENMLCAADGRFYLIDFDVPEISSYWLDVAKLYQDLIGQWCLRRIALDQPDSRILRNAQMALRRMRGEIDTLLKARFPELLPDLPALVCLNLMRALPYSTDEATCLYIVDRVEALLPTCKTGPLPLASRFQHPVE